MKRLVLATALLLAVTGCAETFSAAAASVNGEEISRGELELQIEAQLAGGQAQSDPAARQQLARDLLSSLIRQVLLGQEARARGLEATEEEVTAELDEIRSRYPDEAAFEEAVAGAGLTLDELEERIALQVVADELAAEIAPAPSDEEVRALYEERRDGFREVQVKHILFEASESNPGPGRRRANEALEQIRSGARTFAEVAEDSADPSSAAFGGVLADQNGKRPGWFADGTLDATFFEAAFAASPGELIGPVRTGFGFHLIVTIDKRIAPLGRVRDQLVEELRAQSGDAAVQQAIGEAALVARVLINPRYGDWDPQTLTIVPHESYVPAEPTPSPTETSFVPELGG